MNEIGLHFSIKNGDIVEFHFKIVSLFIDSQINTLIERIHNDGRMIVLDYDIEHSNWYSDLLKIRVKIVDNPFPISLLVGAITSIAVSIFVYLSLDRVYLISREAPDAISQTTSAIGVLGIAIIGIIIYAIIK